MAENESRQVVGTTFTYAGLDNYARALGNLGKQAEIAKGFVGGLTHSSRLLQAGMAVLAGYAGGRVATGIGKVGSEMENIQTKLAGTLSALNFSPSFQEGLKDADGVMNSLYAAAAKLPGETEDYIQVFTQSLPVLSQVKGGLKGMTDYSNQYVAVMKSMGVETNDAAMNLMRMLSAGHGMAEERSPAFRQLLNYMRVLPGQANLTSRSFDQMSQAARTELLGKAIGRMKDMVTHMQGSWDAIKGAMMSAGHMLFHQATSPLFDSMKQAMLSVADSILDSDGHLTRFGRTVASVGQLISKHIGDALTRVTDKLEFNAMFIRSFMRDLQGNPAVQLLDKIIGKGATFTQGVMGVVKGNAPAAGNVAAGAGVGALFGGPLGALIGGLAGFKNVIHVADVLFDAFMKLVDAVTPVTFVLGGLLATALDDIVPLFDQLSPVLTEGFKALVALVDAALPLVTVALGVITPTLALLGTSFQGWTMIFEQLGSLFKWLGEVLKGFGAWINKWTGGMVALPGTAEFGGKSGFDKQRKAAEGAVGPLHAMLDKLIGMKMPDFASLSATGGKAVKGARPAGHTVQDFRGSRFTIQQDFEKGFDPDRIAVAFAKDLQKAGEQRLQSAGFEPLFGVS